MNMEKLRIINRFWYLSFIGKYHNEVLCDMIPMHMGHLLLRCLWQFYMSVVHDRFRIRNSFVKDEKFITPAPLSLKQVYEDQLKLKR
jgi:hypothetical protein